MHSLGVLSSLLDQNRVPGGIVSAMVDGKSPPALVLSYPSTSLPRVIFSRRKSVGGPWILVSLHRAQQHHKIVNRAYYLKLSLFRWDSVVWLHLSLEPFSTSSHSVHGDECQLQQDSIDGVGRSPR